MYKPDHDSTALHAVTAEAHIHFPRVANEVAGAGRRFFLSGLVRQLVSLSPVEPVAGSRQVRLVPLGGAAPLRAQAQRLAAATALVPEEFAAPRTHGAALVHQR
ncbi:MAG: hypothetical protein IPO97_15230 [Sphingomonadales bacterium]|nr:hypothetical protein [Sphingomonadales bacterium]